MDSIYTDAIQRLYLAYFNRPADPISLEQYIDILTDMLGGAEATQADLQELAETYFSPSQEYADQYAGLSNSQIVNELYNNLFGRDAEPAGLTYWTQALNTGEETFASIALQLTYSAQGTDAETIAARLASANLFTVAVDTTDEILGYQGNAAAAEAREWLATFNFETGAATAAQADEGVATTTGVSKIGEAYNLTKGNDNIAIETAGTVNTVYGFASSGDSGDDGDSTLNAGDVINGNGDTIVRISVDGSDVRYSFIQDIDKFEVVAAEGGEDSFTFEAIDWEDIGEVVLAGGQDDLRLAFDNLEFGTPGSISEGVAGSISMNYVGGLDVELRNDSQGGAQFNDLNDDGLLDANVDVTSDYSDYGAVLIENDLNSDMALGSVTVGGSAADADVYIYDGDGVLSVQSVEVSGQSADVFIQENDGDGTSDMSGLSVGSIVVNGDTDDTGEGGAGAGRLVINDNDFADISVGDVDVAGGNGFAGAFVQNGTGAMVAVGDVSLQAAYAQVYVEYNDDSSVGLGDVDVDGSVESRVVARFNTDSEVVIGDVNVEQTDEGFAEVVTYNNAESAITFGDVDFSQGDDSEGVVYLGGNYDEGGPVSRINDITLGSISMAAGDGADQEVITENNLYSVVTIGKIDTVAGDDADVDVRANNQEGAVIIESITSVAGDSAEMDVIAGGFGQTTIIGDVTLTGGDNADVDLDFGLHGGQVETASGTLAFNYSLTVGDVALTVGDGGDADVYVYNYVGVYSGDADLVNNDITFGDITIVAGDHLVGTNSATETFVDHGVYIENEGNQEGVDGDVVVGDISISSGMSSLLSDSYTGDSTATLSLTVDVMNEGGDTIVGDITLTLNVDQPLLATQIDVVGVASIEIDGDDHTGDVIVGDIAVYAGSVEDMDVDIEIEGDNDQGNEVIGDLIVGDIVVEVDEDADVDIDVDQDVGRVLGSMDTAYASMGDLVVGDVSVSAGANLDLDIDHDYSITNLDAGAAPTSADLDGSMGNVTVGSVTVTAGLDASVTYDVQVTGAGTQEGGGAGMSVGDVVIGAVNLDLGDGANVDVEYSIDGDGNDVGNVTIGAITVSMGAGSTLDDIEIDIRGENIGNVDIGGWDITAGENSLVATSSVSIDIEAEGGNVGDVVIGDRSWTLNDSAVAQEGYYEAIYISAEEYATTTAGGTVNYFGGSIGDVTVGDWTLNYDAPSAVDEFYFNYISLDAEGDIGDVTFGDFTANIDGEIYTLADISIEADGGDIGDVTFGSHTVTLAAGATVEDYDEIDISASADDDDVGGNIGNVTFGDITINLGTSAVYDSGLERDIDAEGNIGNITFGDVTFNVGVDASVADYIYIVDAYASEGSIGNVTMGDLTFSIAGSGDMYTASIDIYAAEGDIGDITLGDITYTLAGKTDDVDEASGEGFSLSATAEGGSIGNITVGDIYVEAGYSAEFDYMSMDIFADREIGDVSIGDITMINNNAHSDIDVNIDISANYEGTGGDLGNLTLGNLTAMASGSNDTSAEIEVYAEGDSVGDVTIGDIEVSALAGSESATGTDVTADVSIDVTAVSGDLGDIVVGSISAIATNSNDAIVYLGFSAATTSQEGDGNVGTLTVGDIAIESSGIILTNDEHTFVGEDAQADVDEYQDRDGVGDQEGDASVWIELDSEGDLGSIVIGDIDLTVTAGGWVELDVDGSDLTADDTVQIGTITFNNTNVTATYTTEYDTGMVDNDPDGNGIIEGNTAPIFDTYEDTAVYQSAANVIMDLGAADVELSVNVVGDGSVGFVSDPMNISSDSPEGNYLGIDTEGSIKLDVAFNVTVDATDTYVVDDVIVGFSDEGEGYAPGDIELGTVDYSGYVLADSATDTQTIDVSAYMGNITIIGSERDDVIISNENATTFTGGGGDDVFVIEDLELDLTADYTADQVSYHTITDFTGGSDSDEVMALGFGVDGDDIATGTASSFDEFIAVALEAMSDPDEDAQVVMVQVGDDVWIAIDDDNADEIDTIIKLVGVDLDDLNEFDFSDS